MKRETPEFLGIAQCFEHRTVEVPEQVDFALNSVTEAKPDCEVRYVVSVNYSWQHDYHSNGSIFGNGCCDTANDQAFSNSA